MYSNVLYYSNHDLISSLFQQIWNVNTKVEKETFQKCSMLIPVLSMRKKKNNSQHQIREKSGI